ncbi:hypothetical protein C8Q79DRAFT_286133 [Trametes meyenii]|nr:hypothetical protein C8Q79DRAFT_286133 [Trametes meyenii]
MNTPAAPISVLPAVPQAPAFAPPAIATTSSYVGSHAKTAAAPNGNARKTAKKAKGGPGRMHPPKALRLCAVGTCPNMLAEDWPFKRCRGCRAGGQKRTVVARCISCSAPVAMPAPTARSSQPPICVRCRQRALAAQAGIILPPPPLSVMGPPPSQPQPSNPHIPRFVAPLPMAPPRPKSIIEKALAFVHPDHFDVFERQDLIPPELHVQPRLSRASLDPPSGYSAIGWPHYGPRGEFLATAPGYLVERPSAGQTPGRGTIPKPLPDYINGRVSVKGRVAVGSGESPYDGRMPIAIFQKQSAISAEGGMVKIPHIQNSGQASSLPTIKPRPDMGAPTIPTPGKKRKRTLAPHPLTTRVCLPTGCGRDIPPHVQGDVYAECGFLRWRKQFRARVAGLSVPTEVAKGHEDQGKAVKQEPGGNAVASSSSSLVAVLPMSAKSESSASISQVSLDDPPTRVPSNDGSRSIPDADTMEVDDAELPLATIMARKRRSASSSELNTPQPASTSRSSPETRDSDNNVPLASLTRETPTIATPPASAIVVPPVVKPPTIRVPPVPPAISSDSSSLHEAPPQPSRTLPRVRLIVRSPPSLSSISHNLGGDNESDDDLPSAVASTTSSPSRLYDDNPPESPAAALSPTTRYKMAFKRASLTWDSDDSDLTPLEESEVDPSESEDEVPPTPQDVVPADLLVPEKPPPPPPPQKHNGICSTVRCMNLVPPDARVRSCSACRSRKRMHNRKQREMGVVVQDEPEEKGMVIQMPADGDLTGYRQCSKKKCRRLIPPETTYPYRTCPPCRADARNRARVIRARRHANLPEDSEDDGDDMPLAVTSAFLKGTTRNGDSTKPQEAETMSASKLPDVPAYQHFAALLQTLRARFHDFAVAQVHYVRYRAQHPKESGDAAKPPRSVNVFRFDGEYSVVADPSGGLVDAVVHTVLRNIQAALGLVFTPVSVNPSPEDSVTAVLRCLYGAQIPLRTAAPVAKDSGSDTPAESHKAEDEPILIKMVGELQVCVAWDRRHRFFSGQRILVRFRLVG